MRWRTTPTPCATPSVMRRCVAGVFGEMPSTPGSIQLPCRHYSLGQKSEIVGEQIAGKMAAEDKEKLEKAIEETIAWLDANQLAEVRPILINLRPNILTCSPLRMSVKRAARLRFQMDSSQRFSIHCTVDLQNQPVCGWKM